MQRSNTAEKIKFYVNDESKRIVQSSCSIQGRASFLLIKKGEALAGFTLHWFYVKR